MVLLVEKEQDGIPFTIICGGFRPGKVGFVCFLAFGVFSQGIEKISQVFVNKNLVGIDFDRLVKSFQCIPVGTGNGVDLSKVSVGSCGFWIKEDSPVERIGRQSIVFFTYFKISG